MRLGLVTPIVTRHPANDAAWTEEAGPAELARIAVAADRLGFHHLTCSEHVAIPASAAAVRGTRYYDPLATFGFLAAHTTRLRFVTHVLVLGYHHPLAIAKRYGTLDRISGGRLILGVGVGTLVEEFALLGAEVAGRGARYEDALRALRACTCARATGASSTTSNSSMPSPRRSSPPSPRPPKREDGSTDDDHDRHRSPRDPRRVARLCRSARARPE